jgi:hypothetical protein
MSSRRQFLKSVALLPPGLAGFVPRCLWAAGSGSDESLPPVRQITRGPKFHWFGYYDKFQFSPDDRFVLGNEVDFEHRSPRPDDVIRIGMVDTHHNDEWIELGETRAWNWQQGCMLQWLPGSDNEIIWNDRDGERFVCHIMNVETRDRRTLPHPIYSISPDGKTGIAPDFSRLNDCRPGYGYAGVVDRRRDAPAPEDVGIGRVDLQSGQQELVIALGDAARIPYTGEPRVAFTPDATHWFNHLLFNTDGTRFFFLHRWRVGQGFGTRAFTADPDGSNPYVLDPYGYTSHFIWRDPEHVMAWAWHPSHKSRFYLYRDLTDQVEPVGLEVMTENGHNTYLPNSGGQWVLSDTYPDAKRLQHPYLFHIPTSQKVALGHFHSPKEYSGEWRCDTHPRSSRDGQIVCIDSPHNGGRQMYLIDIRRFRTSKTGT